MKTGIQMSPTIASDGLNGSAMTMSAKGADMAAYFLRDRIYSDKILAPIREYICNALDEHTKHNITTPVQVRLDKNAEQIWTWSVRDFAKGLNEDSIRNIFGMYFESTKSGNNDQIGGFGIGSKAFHCYTDTFYVDSYFEGTHTKYACVLGGGQKGIPVGEIYKITESPTTETGIMVSADLKAYDYTNFSTKTRDFVYGYSNPTAIEFYYGNTLFKPFDAVYTKKVGNYVINAYDPNATGVADRFNMNSHYSVGTKYTSHYYIRMGGVIYEYKNMSGYDVSAHKPIVVDVPIGALSLPISREGIENTPDTAKVFAEISTIIENIRKEESDAIKVEALETYKLSDRSRIYRGEVFNHTWTDVLPDTYEFLRMLNGQMNPNYTGTDKLIDQKVTTIYTVPYGRSSSMWMKRLQHSLFADPKYIGYYWMYKMEDANMEYYKKSATLDISNIKFVDLKSLKLPKLPSANDGKSKSKGTQYALYQGWHKKIGTFTPEEFSIYQAAKFPNVDIDDEDWHEKVDNFDALNAFTIDLTESRYKFGDRILYANTSKMVNALHLMNFISADSSEYKDASARIRKKAEEIQRRERVMSVVYTEAVNTNYSERVKARLKNDPNTAERLIKAWSKIKNENTTRSRIIRQLNSYTTIDRKDLRALLSLK
jgi:hypothetical protein